MLILDCLPGSNFTWEGRGQSHDVRGRLSEENKFLDRGYRLNKKSVTT